MVEEIKHFNTLHNEMHNAQKTEEETPEREVLLNWMRDYITISSKQQDVTTLDVNNPLIMHIFHNFRDTNNNTILQWWIANDDEKDALYFLEKMKARNIDIGIINEVDIGNQTPLFLAISKKYLSTQQRYHYFYRYHANSERLINFLARNSNNRTLLKQDYNGHTPLHISIIKRDYNTAYTLLKEGKRRNINLLSIHDKNGKTPFEMLNIEYEEAYKIVKDIYCKPVPMFTKEEWNIQKNRLLNLEKREAIGQLSQTEKDVFEISPIARVLHTNSIDGIKENIEKVINKASTMALNEYNISNAELKIKILLDVIPEYENEIVGSGTEIKEREQIGVKHYIKQPEFINHLQNKYLDSELNEMVNQDEIRRLSALLQLSSANLIDAPSGKFYNKGGARTHRIARLLKYYNSVEDKSFSRY